MVEEKVVIEEKANKFEQAVRYFPDAKDGLSSNQVAERVENKLNNTKKKKYAKTLPSIIFHNVFTFFNMLLLSIAIALISVGSFSNMFFLVIITANTAIGIYQENKAKKMIESLKLLTEPMASVIRDGKECIIPCDDIVLDDIVVLSAGKEIPVDAVVLDGNGEVNESLLTGESVPLKKQAGEKVYAGSFVVAGTIYARAEKLGDFTYVNQLQETAKKTKKVVSVLLKSLNAIIRMVSIIIIPLGIGSFIVNLSHNELPKTIALTAGSLVSMIPSGLFLLVSTTLYVSVTKLGRKKAMVQELYSIESLARSDVLCLDKTGTITDGTMHLTHTFVLDESENDLDNVISSFLGSFKESNLTSDALKRKYDKEVKYESAIVIPFSSERKYSAVSFKDKGTYFLGAPEYLIDDEELLNLFQKELDKGNRVLIFTHLEGIYNPDQSKNGKPVCWFVLEDHIREDAFDTIKWFQDNDVELKVISGDNPITVRRIAEVVGIKNANKYISLDGMSLEEVEAIANEYTIFGRVKPEQKEVIIKALKNNKRTVAMTGDGVNDILALKQADCAIAMAAGSEAARNCSQIVLMNSSFASMPSIVEEGRRVINNIQSTASLYIMKTIYAILLSIITICAGLGLSAFGGFEYPFEPKHLYILEFAVIGIPTFFLALQPNNKRVSGSFLKTVFFKAFPAGISLLLTVIFTMFVLPLIGYFNISVPSTIATSVGCLSLSIVGLLILNSLCIPYNKYRLLVCFGMTLLAFVIAILPSSINGISYEGMGFEHFIAILLNVVVCFGIYLFMTLIVLKGKKTEELIDRLAKKVENNNEKFEKKNGAKYGNKNR